MEISGCCGAPIIVIYQSDSPNFTDDDYDLQVPVWVCSQCGAAIFVADGEGGDNHATPKGPGS